MQLRRILRRLGWFRLNRCWLVMTHPHDNLFTRLGVSEDGIGVFAIRDIPQATRLFGSDRAEIVRVLVCDVDKIENLEFRRMYYDFCPVIDGAFIAPRDFNQITMSWYLNHSDVPNVMIDSELHIIAKRLISAGEQLLADYTTYSEHALEFTRRWSLFK